MKLNKLLEQGQLPKSEWELFQQEFLIVLLKQPKSQLGRYFLASYPELGEYMAEHSNLGTPAGVYHPNDDVILERITNNKEAISFILDRIEIVDHE